MGYGKRLAKHFASLALIAGVWLAAAAAAQAADLHTEGAAPALPVYTAAAGEKNSLTVRQEFGGFRFSDTLATISASGGCFNLSQHDAFCPASADPKVDLGDRNDRFGLHGSVAPDVHGGSGNDRMELKSDGYGALDGGRGDDTLIMSGNAPPNLGGTLVGGWGNDKLIVRGSSGALMVGGRGKDRLTVRTFTPFSKLDGGPGNDRETGGPGPDRILGGGGDDRMRGRGARDRYIGGPGDDVVGARDGVDERISCGPGDDFARVDAHEIFILRCNRVVRPG
jgi:Ca2+-binding RTX toxin-like protein